MSKPSKRPGRAARDKHAAILDEAARLRESGGDCIDEAANYPACEELLSAVREAVMASLPTSTVHEGRRYFIATRFHGLQFEVYANPGDAKPLLAGVSASLDAFGHTPGH